MTKQIMDVLINECPGIALGEWGVRHVSVGDLRPPAFQGTPYPVKNPPNAPQEYVCSALWRGFVATYLLTREGDLVLVGYEYPFADKLPQQVNEILEGDFWLVMNMPGGHFRHFIPFRQGKVVTDTTQWLDEDKVWTMWEDTGSAG